MSCRLIRNIFGKTSFRSFNSKSSKSFASEECQEGYGVPKCSTANIAAQPCIVNFRKRPKPAESQPQYSYFLKSMWHSEPCCNICAVDPATVRHDIMYLKTVDYRDRKYQRTWPACPIRCLVPKKCIFEKLDVPEPETRARGQGNPNAKICAKVHDCAKKEKFEMPCKEICKDKKSCNTTRPSCCQRRCTLYPSYSECCAKALLKKRPTECNCYHPGGLCAANEWARRMGLIKPE